MEKEKYYNKYYNKQTYFYGLFFNRQPEYFSSTLKGILYSINYVFILYTIFSIIFTIFYKTFALNIPSFGITENIYTQTMNMLYKNNYNNIFLITVIGFGFISAYYERISYLSIYFILYLSFFLSYFYKIRIGSGIVSYVFYTFTFIQIIGISILVIYSIVYYLKTTGYINLNIEGIPAEDLINEVKLRMDMYKINFNATLVKFGLQNIFRRFMFKKEDYYFMNVDKEKEENERIKKEINENESIYNKSSNNSYSFNTEDQTQSNIDNNYSQLDNDCYPLK